MTEKNLRFVYIQEHIGMTNVKFSFVAVRTSNVKFIRILGCVYVSCLSIQIMVILIYVFSYRETGYVS